MKCRSGLCASVLGLLASIAVPVLAQDAPPNLTAWSDLDTAVANAYAGLTNVAVIYPPGSWHFAIDQGYFTFTDGGDIAVLTNVCTCSTQFNVPVWQFVVVETQLTTRVWLYEGAGGASFYTNQYPASYDPVQWVQSAYSHDAPGYLTGADLDDWYAERDRSRFYLTMTLVDQNDWPALQAAEWAAATNAPALAIHPPVPPADTNQLAFAGFQINGTDTVGIWIYSPSARPVSVLACPALSYKTNIWTVLGTFNAVPPFQLWQTPNTRTAFFRIGYTDVDSDGDGLPDLFETYVYGTNPYNSDSDCDGISDFNELLINGTDPWNPDVTPPTVFIVAPANGEWKAVLP